MCAAVLQDRGLCVCTNVCSVHLDKERWNAVYKLVKDPSAPVKSLFDDVSLPCRCSLGPCRKMSFGREDGWVHDVSGFQPGEGTRR